MMNDTMTAPSVVEERYRVLRSYAAGYGLAAPRSIGPRPGLLDDEGRRALGVNSYSELMQVLRFAQAMEPRESNFSIAVDAACSILNLQRDTTPDPYERQKRFVQERIPGAWRSLMHRVLGAELEERGLRRLALTFPELQRQLAEANDGK